MCERFDHQLVVGGLQALEPRIHASPAGAHELDEKRKVVDTSMTLGEQVAFESLEPPDRLVQETANLCNVAGHREYLDA